MHSLQRVNQSINQSINRNKPTHTHKSHDIFTGTINLHGHNHLYGLYQRRKNSALIN